MLRKYMLGIVAICLCLLLATNTALAASWIRVGRTSKDNPINMSGVSYSEYIDKASVRKDGDRLIFWHKLEYDKLDEDSGEATLTKNEVILSTLKTRTLETIDYDGHGVEKKRYSEPTHWVPYQKGSQFELKIQVALKYAKDGKDAGPAPKL
ncbi:MAG: hypothetical protein AB9917_18325 [Negativicutes bacterium]